MIPVTLIWAQARNGVIGAGNKLPWHLPEDLAFFKAQTMGDTVIMGRATWDSLPEKSRPLPGRRNIVITRQNKWEAPGAERAGSVEEAVHLARYGGSSAKPQGLIWVIGGGSIYRQALPLANTVIATVIDIEPVGDTFAPALPDWDLQRGHWETSRTGVLYRHDMLERVQPLTASSAAAATRTKATDTAAASRTSERYTAAALGASVASPGSASAGAPTSGPSGIVGPPCSACAGLLAG